MEQVKRVSDQKSGGVLLSGPHSDANGGAFEAQPEDCKRPLPAFPVADRIAADEPIREVPGGGGSR